MAVLFSEEKFDFFLNLKYHGCRGNDHHVGNLHTYTISILQYFLSVFSHQSISYVTYKYIQNQRKSNSEGLFNNISVKFYILSP